MASIQSNDTVDYGIATSPTAAIKQCQCPSGEPIPPEGCGAKAKRAAAAIFNARYLPLANDKVRNNIRNRPFLASVYAMGAAFVALLAILLLDFETTSQWSMTYAVPPQSVVYLGTAMDTFVVQIVTSEHKGVPDLPLQTTLIPIGDIEVLASLRNGFVLSHSISCPVILNEYNTGKFTDRFLCSPEEYNGAWNFTAVTDYRGMAKFEGMTVGFGAPATYVLVVSVEVAGQTQILSSVVTFKADVVSTELVVQNDHAGVLSSLLTDSAQLPPNVLNFTFAVSWRSPRPPMIVCAVMMSLDLQGVVPKTNTVPMPASDTITKLVDFSQNSFCVGRNQIFPEGSLLSLEELIGNETSASGSSDSGDAFVTDYAEASVSSSSTTAFPLYVATFNVLNLYLSASNSDQVFPGVNFFGVTVPISSFKLESMYQEPGQIIFPFTVQTNVESAFAGGLPNEVAEGEEWSNFVMASFLGDGTVVNRVGFVYVKPSPDIPSLNYEGPSASSMIGANNKIILQDSFETCYVVNCTTFQNSTSFLQFLTGDNTTAQQSTLNSPGMQADRRPSFSVSGAVGTYRVYAAVDGVLAKWPSNNNLTYFTIIVRSIVDFNVSAAMPIIWIGGLGSETYIGNNSETIGAVWKFIPMLRIADSSGRGIVGKTFDVRPKDPNASAITYSRYPVQGSADYANIYKITTTFRTGGSGPIEYQMFVDGQLVKEFTRYFTMPHASDRQGASPDECQFVQVVDYPEYVYADMDQSMLLRAVSLNGTVLKNVSVVLEVPLEFMPPLTTVEASQVLLTSDPVTGLIKFRASPLGITGISYCYASVFCAGMDPSSTDLMNQIGFIYQTRVTSVDVQSLSNRSSIVKINANWSLVSVVNPIVVSGTFGWFPSYATFWYSSESFPQITDIVVTGPNDSTVTVAIQNSSHLPGLYGVQPMVGGVNYNPFATTVFGLDIGWVQLVQSAFSQNETVRLEQVLPNQPVVRVFKRDGTPAVNYRAFAQPMFTLPDGTELIDDAAMSRNTLQYGLFVRLGCSNASCAKAVSGFSDNEGYAYFSNLTFIAGQTGVRISLRYCVALDVASNPYALKNTTSFCVNDTGYAVLDYTQQMSFRVDQSSLTGTPGQFLGNITVESTIADGTQPVMIACIAFLDDFSQSILEFPETYFLPTGAFVGVGMSTLRISQQIRIAETALTGNHQFYFVCAGGITNKIPLTITSTPFQVAFTYLPYLRRVGVRSIFVVGAKVSSVSGSPLANVPVKLSMERPSDDNTTCIGLQCGFLYETAIQFGTTDQNGNVQFAVGVQYAQTGNYTLVAEVVSVSSRASIQYSAFTSLTSVLGTYGMSSTQALAACRNSTECFPTLLSVLNELSSDVDSTLYTSSFQHFFSWFGGSSTTAVRTAATIFVTNPVAVIEITRQPNVRLSIPSSRSIVNNFIGMQPEVFTIHEDDLPIVRMLDRYGNPVVNASVTMESKPGDAPVILNPLGSNISTFATLSNASGYARLLGVTITVSSAVTFQIFLTSNGGGGNLTVPLVITQANTFGEADTMRLAAGMLVIFFSPLLASSVPHSRFVYLLLGVISAVGSGLATFFLRPYLPQNKYVKGYYDFLLGAVSLLGCAAVWILLVHVVGECCGVKSWRTCNDERKGDRVLQYSRWITNVRAVRQRRQFRRQYLDGATEDAVKSEELLAIVNQTGSISVIEEPAAQVIGAQELPSPIASDRTVRSSHADLESALLLSAIDEHNARKKLRSSLAQRIGYRIAGTINELLDEDFLDVDNGDKKIRRTQNFRPTIIYTLDILKIEPVYYPFNFIIVCSITMVLFIIEVFLLLYLYNYIRDKSELLLSYLPSRDNDGDVERAGKLLSTILQEGITFCTTRFPAMYSLSKLLPAIQSFDLVRALTSFHNTVEEAIKGVVILFAVAGSVATVALFASMYLTARKIPKLIRRIRRGRLSVSSYSTQPMEAYIGLHCWHMIIVHQLVFWLVVIFGMLMVISPIRRAIFSALSLVVVASVASYIVQFVVEYVFVRLFLSSGPHFVVRPELYALWHFAGLILGIFTGLMKSFARWVFSVAAMSVLFSRLDQSILPQSLQAVDVAHSGFMSVIAVEAKNGNPIFITFCSLLLAEQELQRLAAKQAAWTQPQSESDTQGDSNKSPLTPPDAAADDDDTVWALSPYSVFDDDRDLSAGVKNCIHSYLVADHCTVEGGESPKMNLRKFWNKGCAQARRKRMRTQQKWWLLMVLMMNPSLRQERKHCLYLDETSAHQLR